MANTNHAPSTESSELIRTGRDGRQRYTEGYRRRVLDAFEARGMSGKAFAEQCGIKYASFAWWLAKRRNDTRPAAADDASETPAFLPAEIGETTDDARKVTPAGGAATGVRS